jgi:hypothetical protein
MRPADEGCCDKTTSSHALAVLGTIGKKDSQPVLSQSMSADRLLRHDVACWACLMPTRLEDMDRCQHGGSARRLQSAQIESKH